MDGSEAKLARQRAQLAQVSAGAWVVLALTWVMRGWLDREQVALLPAIFVINGAWLVSLVGVMVTTTLWACVFGPQALLTRLEQRWGPRPGPWRG